MMFNYLKNLEIEVSDNIANGELDIALKLVIEFVQSIIQDKRATAKVFGSATLDNLCQQIGAKTLANESYVVQTNSETENKLIIYIATELSNTGGHTAVLEDFIKFQPDKKHLILITDIFGTGNREVIEKRFASFLVDIEWASKGTHEEKLHWLQQQLIAKQPSQVVLFNHWQDAVAIAAVQPVLTPKLIFYHHCDHNLCLGLYLSHAQHIDPHSFGFYNCSNNLRVKNTIYIPLVVDDLGTRPANIPFLGDTKLRTCSSGSENKFEQGYSYVYVEEISNILEVTGGFHIHIGELSPSALDIINTELDKKGIESERFIHIPWVKSVWKAMHDQRIDVYISSFPICGARASVEVMGSGTPIIGHQNYHSRLLGGIDIIYPEAFFWEKPDELYSYLQTLTDKVLLEEAAYSRKHYELYHKPDVFKECLDNLIIQQNALIPLPLKQYFCDYLQVFIDDKISNFDKEFKNLVDANYPILEKNKLYLDKAKVSDFLYWIATSKLKLERSHSQLQYTQTELERSQSQLQYTQAEFERSQSQLQYTQTELERSQSQLQYTQAEFERSQSQLQYTQTELERSHSQLQYTQTELERSHSQLQYTQTELERSHSQLQYTQTELERSQSQLQQTQVQLERSQSQLQHTQTELTPLQSQLQHTQVESQRLQQRIKAMESSKFWKLRKVWIQFKRQIGLEVNE